MLGVTKEIETVRERKIKREKEKEIMGMKRLFYTDLLACVLTNDTN